MAGVIDGQPVNQTITNAAFIYKNGPDEMPYELTLSATSSSTINDIQLTTNTIIDAVGGTQDTPATNFGNLPDDTFLDTDTHDIALGKLARKFYGDSASGGHTHDGTDGNGPPIAATGIQDVTLLSVRYAIGAFNTTGASSVDVSGSFALYTASHSATAEGIVTFAPYNLVDLTWSSNGELTAYQVNDPLGNQAYGRLTESAGTWTLNTYVLISGVETGYAIPTSLIVSMIPRVIINPIDNQGFQYPFPQLLAKNVNSLSVSGSTAYIYGSATLSEGSGISLTQSGQNIEIEASGSATKTVNSNKVAIAASAASVVIPFTNTFASATGYTIVGTIHNDTDSTPDILGIYKFNQGTTACTAYFAPSADTGNYILNFFARELE